MLAPVTRRSVTEEVFERIVSLIKSGSHPVGTRLPSEKALCESLSVGHSSVREALKKLQALGFVEIRRGRGVFVVSATGQSVDSGYSSWFEANKSKLKEIWELRIAIECSAAALAAQRATPEEIEVVSRAEEQFETSAAAGNPQLMAKADEAFHYAILHAAHNAAIVAVYDMIREPLFEFRQQIFSLPDVPRRATDPHRILVSAIRGHLPGAARETMHAHLFESRVGTALAAHTADHPLDPASNNA